MEMPNFKTERAMMFNSVELNVPRLPVIRSEINLC